ncbi:response regulator transcription factor [Demequina sp. NBRC 110057]|uniref:response regulator n=1 Tax=Demequina sp. NBRC 110057 TaxID=1570346 RepID=UPI000A05D2F0|nr:response regulator transcription factor [Demequina sp. NBRC 110057]
MTGSAPDSLTVLLVDDDPLVRQQVRFVLASEPTITVVGEAADGEAALDGVARLDPDVTLMDVSMPRMTGVEATTALTARGSRTRVIALTAMDSDAVVIAMLEAGAQGFVPKEYAGEDLLAAVASVARGGGYVSPFSQPALFRHLAGQRGNTVRDDAARRLDALSERERAVARLVATGAKTADIAGTLYVSESTVKSQLESIRAKLDVSSREEIAVLVERAGETLTH